MVFLDISKAIDRVWHKGLLWKLEYLGIRHRLLSWIHSYLTDRKHRVVIDDQSSDWLEIKVPQGLILAWSLALFDIYQRHHIQSV